MKLFFVLAVAASTSMLLVQGAPQGQITSEEMGKVVDQLKEMIKSKAARLASHPQGQGYGRPVSIIDHSVGMHEYELLLSMPLRELKNSLAYRRTESLHNSLEFRFRYCW